MNLTLPYIPALTGRTGAWPGGRGWPFGRCRLRPKLALLFVFGQFGLSGGLSGPTFRHPPCRHPQCSLRQFGRWCGVPKELLGLEIQNGRRQPGDDLLVAGVLLELDRVLVEQPLETFVQGVIFVFDLNESQPIWSGSTCRNQSGRFSSSKVAPRRTLLSPNISILLISVSPFQV